MSQEQTFVTPLPATIGRQRLGNLQQTTRRLRRHPIGTARRVDRPFLLIALFAPWVATHDPATQASKRLLLASAVHLMGTDELGRDVFSRIVFAFPTLVLAIVITGLLGPSLTNAMLAIGIVYSPTFARVARSSVLSVKNELYIEAARVVGGKERHIVMRHVLPNILAPLIVLTTLSFSLAILAEASLSFLGLGTQPPDAAWGLMLSQGRKFMEVAPWLAIFPGLAIMITVLAFNFLGDGLRDALDPRLHE